MLEHRWMLVAVGTLALQHAQEQIQISKLQVAIRDQLATTGQIEGHLRRLEQVDTSSMSTIAVTIWTVPPWSW